jgi:hypothetical protein
MGIESEADKDLALEDEDAEGVTGGTTMSRKKKAAAKGATAHGPTVSAATGHVGPPTTEPTWGATETDPAIDPSTGNDPALDS